MPGFSNTVMRGFQPPGVMEADFSHDTSQMPARKHIVANSRNAIGCERLMADPENRVLGVLWHPAKNAMANHIVKLFRQRNIGQINLPKLHISSVERSNSPLANVDMSLREVDPQEAGLRKTLRKRNDVATRRTAKLKYAG